MPAQRRRKVFCHGAKQDALGGARPHGGGSGSRAGGRGQAVHGLANDAPRRDCPQGRRGHRQNYLTAAELEALNRIVSAYLEFAEVQAMNRRPMTMRGWIGKLDDFLKLSDREILTHAGKISHETAAAKAELEFSKFRALEDAKPSAVEKSF